MIEISGKVIGGQKFGRVLGFPTANLDRRQYLRKKMKVKFGVWAGQAKLQVGSYKLKIVKAAIVIGPLDKTGRPKIEAHLLGFNKNLYGKKITISLIKYLRQFVRYKNLGSLKNQIQKDINEVKRLKY